MKSNNLIIGALVLTLVVMGVAYAAFSTSLTINGTATVDSTWGPIYLSSCSCSSSNAKDADHPSSATCTPVTGSSTDILGTISATMVSPGDVVTCTFNVKNAGTLHAAAPTYTVTPTNNNYYTVVASGGTCIKAGGTGSFMTTITYKSSVTSAPTSNQSFVVKASYSQAATCTLG